MYDNHIQCEEYSGIKDVIISILNNEIDDYNIEELSNCVQELYDTGNMSSSQYDDLMSYLQDLQ